MRVRCPPSRLTLTRVGLFDFGSTSITLEMWIGPSFSITPPTDSARCASRIECGLVCRFWMFMPSTKTRFFFGSTRRTLPVLPLSLPEMTSTVSSRRIFKPMSEHLRRKGDDLHEVAVAQLARDRPEDARAARIVGGVDDHRSVLVEGDVGAVLAAELLARANHHGGHDLALLHVAVRDRLL